MTRNTALSALTVALTLVVIVCHCSNGCPTPLITDLVAYGHFMGHVRIAIPIVLAPVYDVILHEGFILTHLLRQVSLV